MKKSFLKRIIPSYRVAEKLSGQIDYLNWHISQLENRLSDLDYKNEYLFWLANRKDEESYNEEKKRMFAEMPKAEGILRDFQLSEVELMNKIQAVCQKNNIEIFLTGGSLLGAVRHKGFIPWDDDVDFCIFRSDLNKFFECICNEKDLQINYYYNCFDGYRIIKVKNKKLESLYVDFFVLDCFEAANDSDANEKIKIVLEKSRDFSCYIKSVAKQNNVDCNNCTMSKQNAINGLINKKEKELIDSLGFYGKGNYVCLGLSENPVFIKMNKFYKTQTIFPLKSICFEGYKFNAPNNIDEYLRTQYDDYWSLPTIIKNMHSTETIDLFVQEIIKA